MRIVLKGRFPDTLACFEWIMKGSLDERFGIINWKFSSHLALIWHFMQPVGGTFKFCSVWWVVYKFKDQTNWRMF